jgi:hypothetical protein
LRQQWYRWRVVWRKSRAVTLWQRRDRRWLRLIDLGLMLHHMDKPLANITRVCYRAG